MLRKLTNAAVILLGAIVFTIPARAEQGEARIGVVSVSRVLKSYQKVNLISDKMKQLFEKDDEALKKEERDLMSRREMLKQDPRAEDNPELFKEIQKWQMDEFGWKTKRKKLGLEIEERRKNEMKSVLNDVRLAIRAIGSADKFEMILRAPEFDDVFDPKSVAKDDKDKEDEPKSSAELVRMFRENPVMYFSSGIDITDKVIAKLNDDFKKGQGK